MKKWLLLLCLLPFITLAWNLPGHALVAQLAYNQLPPADQQQADQLANRIYQQLPSEEQLFLTHKLGAVSVYAKTAALPDSWLSLSLGQVFTRFHAALPPLLQPYKNDSTASWHFINEPFGYSYCHSVRQQNVVWAISLLQQAYHQTQDANSRAIILILLTHFVGDAHQPLHVVTRVNWACQGDGGGNGYCLKAKNGVCVYNLHHYWDGAAGYLHRYPNISKDAHYLMRHYPETAVANQATDLQPADWVKAENATVKAIYATPQYHWPSRHYKKWAQGIAKHQLVLAGYRLAAMIKHLIAGTSQSG